MGQVTDSDAAEKTPGPTEPTPGPTERTPGFGERGRMRRRARFLRKARELAYRDLGGLVFELHRFGRRNDPVVMAKLATLTQIHAELSALESALRERQGVTVLREVGIAACPRCAAIHGGDDRFCPGCGLAFDAKADRPLSSSPVTQGPLSPSPAGAPAHTQTPPAQAATPPMPLPASPSPLTAPRPAPASSAPKAPESSQTPPPAQTPPPFSKTTPPSQTPPVRAPSPRTPAPAPKNDGIEEEQPTQILRPPGGSA
jgi:hypothetical protein